MLRKVSQRKGPPSLGQRGERPCQRKFWVWVSTQRQKVKDFRWEPYSMLEKHKVGMESEGHMGCTACAKVSRFCPLVNRFLRTQKNGLL